MTPEANMIFSPTTTGPLHVGNLLGLWLTARESEARGIPFGIRYDDANTWNISHDSQTPERIEETHESVGECCSLLDVMPAFEFSTSARKARYLEVAQEMLRDGRLISDVQDGSWIRHDAIGIKDRVKGWIRDYDSIVVYRGTPYSTLTDLVDTLDYGVPMWIDGPELIPDMFSVLKLWDLYFRGRMPYRESAHIPAICDCERDPIHKSSNPCAPYYAENFAFQFKKPGELRHALEAMILPDGATQFLWDDVLTCWGVSIDSTGKRVSIIPHPERGQYASLKLGMEC